MADQATSAKFIRGFGLFMFAATGIPYAVSGLIAPLWGLLVLWAIWIGLLVFLIWSWRRNPWLVFAIPFIAGAAWWGVISIGDAIFDWTA